MILFEPSKSRRFSVRIELQAHDSPAWVSTWLAALPTIASLRETGYRRDGVQNSVDRSLAECVEAEVGVALVAEQDAPAADVLVLVGGA